ncbi:MAG: lactonase family protein [Leptospirales bacterium]
MIFVLLSVDTKIKDAVFPFSKGCSLAEGRTVAEVLRGLVREWLDGKITLSVAFLMALLLSLSACGGGGGGAGGGAGSGSGSGSSGSGGAAKILAGVVYTGNEGLTQGEIDAQPLYTDGSTGTATLVASYCHANNDGRLVADTAILTGTTYMYAVCRGSGTVIGWRAGSNATTPLAQVADVSIGSSSYPMELAVSKNGKYLFVVCSNNTLQELEVNADGSLTSLGAVLSFSGSYGVYSAGVSPSGNYLVLARANSSATAYYLDEYALDETTGGLSQIGTDVTVSTLNTAGGMYPAPNTNNGDLIAYVTGQSGNQLILIAAGSSWGTSNLTTHSFSNFNSAVYGGAAFDPTGKYLWVGAWEVSSTECNLGDQLRSYSIGTGGSSVSLNGYVCGTSNNSATTVAYDSANDFLISQNVWNVSKPAAPTQATSNDNPITGGGYGAVFVPAS